MQSLDKIVRIVRNAVAPLVIAGAVFGYGCESKNRADSSSDKNSSPSNYSLQFVGEKVWSGYQKPESLKFGAQDSSSSQTYDVQLLVNPDSTVSSVFLERPTLTSFLNPDYTPEKEPKINDFSGTLADINNGNAVINNIFKFPSSYASEFNTMQGSLINGVYTPFGLSLRIQRLGSDYLVSKSPSSRISRFSPLTGLENTFARDDELIGIVDMIGGNNGRIYLAQSMIVGNCDLPQTSWTVARPRKVISVDPNDLLNPNLSLKYIVEFTLPDGKIPLALTRIDPSANPTYGGKCYPTDDMVRLVENSVAGKTANGINFFATDFLNNQIYAVTAGLVSQFKDVLHPTSLAMEQNGKIIVTKAPILQGDPANPIFLSNSEMIEVDPANPANPVSLYAIQELASDFYGYLFPEDPVKGTWVPTAYSVSNNIAEDATSLTSVLTNTASGKVTAVKFLKQ